MLDPKDFDKSKPLPTADIKANIENDGLVQHHSYQVIPTEVDKNEFMYSIRVSYLIKWSKKLTTLSYQSFPWHELIIAIATLLAGASLSALIAEVPLNSSLGVLFYVVHPPIIVGLSVSYFFIRSKKISNTIEIVTEINDEVKSLLKEDYESR